MNEWKKLIFLFLGEIVILNLFWLLKVLRNFVTSFALLKSTVKIFNNPG